MLGFGMRRCTGAGEISLKKSKAQLMKRRERRVSHPDGVKSTLLVDVPQCI